MSMYTYIYREREIKKKRERENIKEHLKFYRSFFIYARYENRFLVNEK